MEKLKEKSSVKVVLAYTTAGLGHLRVTNALFEAAPKDISPVLLRSKDHFAVTLHRLTSIHPLARKFMEWSQRGMAEIFFSYSYSKMAHLSSKRIFDELSTLVEEDFNITKELVIVCTHFGLAHEISGMKEKLAKKLNCSVRLVVVVTDASPQKVWVVSKADLTFVPSLSVGKTLETYAMARGWNFKFEVISYPLNPSLSEKLSSGEYKNRLEQANPKSNTRIHVLIPISGAAVSLLYYENLIRELHQKEKRFFFYIVSKEDMYTYQFLRRMGKYDFVSIVKSTSSREIVTFYSELLSSSIFSLEVVKPSEQAFKALLPTDTKGGVILLFSNPVGRQEYDNLSFLKNHNLIPKRAILLTGDAKKDTQIVFEKLNNSDFLEMIKQSKHMNNEGSVELSSDGAKEFWKRIVKLL